MPWLQLGVRYRHAPPQRGGGGGVPAAAAAAAADVSTLLIGHLPEIAPEVTKHKTGYTKASRWKKTNQYEYVDRSASMQGNGTNELR